MKKIYYVTMTYLNTIEAESYEEAEQLTEEMIRNGDIVPNEIETEIKDCNEEQEEKTIYQYFDKEFDDYEEILDYLVDIGEIRTFNDWLDNNYSASDIYTFRYENLSSQYREYKKDIFTWCIQVGRVKEIKK